MKSNVYEGLFLLDVNRYNRDPEGVAGVIPKLIEEFGGEVMVSRFWEERRLAYPVKGHRKGTYWLTYFRMPTDAMAGLRDRFQIIDSILRFMFVRIEDRIVDQLVAHASGLTLVAPVVAAPAAEVPVPPVAEAVVVETAAVEAPATEPGE